MNQGISYIQPVASGWYQLISIDTTSISTSLQFPPFSRRADLARWCKQMAVGSPNVSSRPAVEFTTSVHDQSLVFVTSRPAVGVRAVHHVTARSTLPPSRSFGQKCTYSCLPPRPRTGTGSVVCRVPTCEFTTSLRRQNRLKGLKDFHLKNTAKFWPLPSYLCHTRQ